MDDFKEDTHAITKYTLAHLLLGTIWRYIHILLVGDGYINESVIIMTVFHIAFEIFENTDYGMKLFQRVPEWKDYRGDSLANSFFDVVAGIVGFFIADFR